MATSRRTVFALALALVSLIACSKKDADSAAGSKTAESPATARVAAARPAAG